MRFPILVALALLTAAPLALRAQDTAVPNAPLSVIPTPVGASAVTLRYKFTPGQTRRYKMAMTMNMTMLTGQSGAGVPMNMTMTMTTKQTVKSVRASDGAATVVAQVEDIETNAGGKEVALPAAQQAQMKKPFTTVMLPTGKVLSFQMPGFTNIPTTGMPGMDLSKGLMSSSVAFPDAPVKVGNSWPGTIGSGIMAGMQMLMMSTLTGVETKGGAQLATVNQKITGKINMTLSKPMPMAFKMAGTVTGSGTQVFDTSAGAIVSQNMVNNTDMTMTFHPAAGQTAPPGMPKTMKMTMQQKTDLTLLDDSSPATLVQ